MLNRRKSVESSRRGLALLPAADGRAAREIAERSRAAIAAVPVDGRELSASAGVASGQPASTALTESLTIADEALYEAKGAGRNRTVVAPQTNAAAIRSA